MYTRDYFYDKQLRRYILQIIRFFSGFKVYNGKKNGVDSFRLVPCTYADMSRLGATYLSSNSENILSSAPMLSLHITDFQPLAEYRHTPHYEGVSHFTEKQRNETGEYINKPARKYTVTQLMPVPFTMNINVDVWTTSTDQKMELLEQILVWYNPGFEFRVNSSPLDMGNVSNIQLENIQWSSRSVPQGTSTEIDVMTLTFRVYPVFITPPAKIRKQTKIHSIFNNLEVSESTLTNSLADIFERNNYVLEPVIVTPSGFGLEVFKEGNDFFAKLPSPTGYANWTDLFNKYGKVDEGVTTLRIGQSNDPQNIDKFIFGTFFYTSDPKTVMIEFDVDTFSSTTLPDVDRVIDPNTVPAVEAQTVRYLLAYNITDPSLWGGLEASRWDIIQSDDGGQTWYVSFNASSESGIEFVINRKKNTLYRFENSEWVSAVEGTYNEGFWAFDIEKLEGS